MCYYVLSRRPTKNLSYSAGNARFSAVNTFTTSWNMQKAKQCKDTLNKFRKQARPAGNPPLAVSQCDACFCAEISLTTELLQLRMLVYGQLLPLSELYCEIACSATKGQVCPPSRSLVPLGSRNA